MAVIHALLPRLPEENALLDNNSNDIIIVVVVVISIFKKEKGSQSLS
jgi:hypothetical protein